MDRRNFIKSAGMFFGAATLPMHVVSCASCGRGAGMRLPDSLEALYDGGSAPLAFDKNTRSFRSGDIRCETSESGGALTFFLSSPSKKIRRVTARWNTPFSSGAKILNDHWERGYGDLRWSADIGEKRILPWYFMEYGGGACRGVGVKVQPNAFCSWSVSPARLELKMDVRNGSRGVRLGRRRLEMATVVSYGGARSESPFEAACNFCKIMCENPRLPQSPVYGVNDWYCLYGKSSQKLIVEIADLMSGLLPGGSNRPFFVVDGGWNKISPKGNRGGWSDDFRLSNEFFPDMKELAGDLRKRGFRPGLWMRPLCAPENAPEEILLPFIHAESQRKFRFLDPTIARNVEYLKECFAKYREWGMEMVKHDFTSYDLFGKWGFKMFADGDITRGDWSFADDSKTNAEIVLDLYRLVRRECGGMYVIGCDTFSHLSAGLFELQRTGDDTSGREWARTLKMGVNTLAFRAPQHNAFYSCDADCVGLTDKVEWRLNRQWMELLAGSGTPLFISPLPKAVGAEQRECIKRCFDLASRELPTGEPLDWLESLTPRRWKLCGEVKTFNWS